MKRSSPIFPHPQSRRLGFLLAAVTFAALVIADLAAPASASAQGAPFCKQGEVPAFTFGFAALKAELGPIMGTPVECAHPNDANGDVLQNTTTGLSFWRKSTNTPTFTDGYRHWGLAPGGMVAWVGSAIDPPGTAVPAQSRPSTATSTGAGAPPLPADVVAYLNYIQPRLIATTEALQTITDQSRLVGPNPAVIFDPTWRSRTNVALNSLRRNGRELQNYGTVSPALAELDQTVKSIGADLVYVADEYEAGLNTQNGDRFQNAATRLRGLPAKTNLATTQLQALQGGTAAPAPARPPAPAPAPARPPAPAAAPTGNCHPSYPDFCIPPSPPNLNCDSPAIAGRKNFTVRQPDPHGFDRDKDGVGCEQASR